MDWIIHPISYYFLLAVGLSLSLFLFVSVKKENADLRHELAAERRQRDAAMIAFQSSLSRLEVALQEAGEAAEAPLMLPPLPTASMNINKRGQALRMHRRGETIEQIAATLQVPRSEVELLLKVHRAVIDQA
ncbi:hypothetical protein [Paludibaculum fermentans]|uniref:hypothetical protein n=1 Tax=Paludibaculum fermentans TaxID=1473598 RepID=UPI003EBC61DA